MKPTEHIYPKSDINPKDEQEYWIETGNISLDIPESLSRGWNGDGRIVVEAQTRLSARKQIVDIIAQAIEKMTPQQLRDHIKKTMHDSSIIRSCRMSNHGEAWCRNEISGKQSVCDSCRELITACQNESCDCDKNP